MATSAFKSTTRRLSIVGAGGGGPDDSSSSSSNGKPPHRRSRSLSRFSRRLLSELEEEDYRAAPRGKFVNTVRGSDFQEISLDDLALQFFSSKDNNSNDDKSSKNGKSNNDEEINSGERSRGSEIGRWASETASSARRGRSVSRHHREPAFEDKKVVSNGSSAKIGNSEANSRRRRSLSVARYRRSGSEVKAKVHCFVYFCECVFVFYSVIVSEEFCLFYGSKFVNLSENEVKGN